MQKILLLIIVLCSLTANAQQWVDIQIDDKLTAKLPPGNWYVDTLNGQNWVGQDTACGFLISKSEMDPEMLKETTIRTDEHLKGFYSSVVEGMTNRGKEMNMELLDHDIIDWEGLLVLNYHYKVLNGSQRIEAEGWQLLLDKSFYLFVCNYDPSVGLEQRHILERDKFFNGIALATTVDRNDQYILSGLYHKIGRAIGGYLPHILVGIVIALAFYFNRRRKKRLAAASTQQ